MSAWGEQWRGLLAIDEGARRARAQGLAWARAGRVSDLRTTTGRLAARVQGGRATPYLVELSVPVLVDREWEAVAAVVASRARHEAQLLAGHVPDGLIGDLARTGVALFPEPSQVDVACPCGRERLPCEHVVAAWEAAAERFEHDPFSWLRMRGRGRERLLADIARARRRTGSAPASQGVPVAHLRLGQWRTATVPIEDAVVSPAAPPETPAGPLRLLGDPPGWAGGVGAGDLFSPLVERAAANVASLAAALEAGSDGDD